MDDKELSASALPDEENSSFLSTSNRSFCLPSSEPFKPANFPTSESFTHPPAVPETLPGVRPVRESPFEASTANKEKLHSGDEDEYDDADNCNTFFHCLLAILVLFTAMIVAVIVIEKSDQFDSSPLYRNDFDIMSDINKNVVGQSHAIYAILKALKNMSHQPAESSWCHVLLLTGGPGVGKDYTVELVKSKFFLIGGQECREHSHHTLYPGALKDIHFCWRRDFNIYSFDTLYSKDESQVKQAITTVKYITRVCSDFNKRLTLLVPILPAKAHSTSINRNDVSVDMLQSSTEYLKLIEDEGTRIKKKFDDAGISSELIIYRPIDWDDLRKCIISSAQQQARATLSPQAVDEIVRSLRPLGGRETDFVPIGCKDVDAMVALLPPKASSETKVQDIEQ
ncbi:hypothetical protein B566_EDAN016873 [Ephemera danica]|nr:hypothetical protein B566_EDAN016873 [Ephemera danica]